MNSIVCARLLYLWCICLRQCRAISFSTELYPQISYIWKLFNWKQQDYCHNSRKCHLSYLVCSSCSCDHADLGRDDLKLTSVFYAEYLAWHLLRPLLSQVRDIPSIHRAKEPYEKGKKNMQSPAENTVQCRYNAVNFLPKWNPHKRHPIARPLGQDMRCLLWVEILMDILSQSQKWCMQYHVILDCIIMVLDSTLNDQYKSHIKNFHPVE